MNTAGNHIALIGLTGSGKTAVGRHLADLVHRPFVDSDALIAEQQDTTGRHIAGTQGTAALHALEHHLTRCMLARNEPSVLGIPASALDDPDLVEELAAVAWVVWLIASPEVLSARMQPQTHRRPLSVEDLGSLLTTRTPAFTTVADVVIDTGGKTPKAIAAEIHGAWS